MAYISLQEWLQKQACRLAHQACMIFAEIVPRLMPAQPWRTCASFMQALNVQRLLLCLRKARVGSAPFWLL